MQPLAQLQLDDFRVTVFNLGYLALDGGAMFGVVPKTMWNRLMPADAQNRVNLATHCLLIEQGEHKWFVDAGVGMKFSEKYQAIYGVRPPAGMDGPEDAGQTPVDAALASVGLTSGEITHAVFTHLHFDHAGGATRFLPNGQVTPTFENARYVIHQGEWDYAICPHERCKASYLKENLEPVLQAGQLQLLQTPQTELAPGLTLKVSGGHTPFHQVLMLETRTGGLVYWGDLIPTRHHVRIPFVMGYDEYPVETMAVKKRWLNETVEKGWWHVFEHDPEQPVCQLQPTGQPDAYEVLRTAG